MYVGIYNRCFELRVPEAYMMRLQSQHQTDHFIIQPRSHWQFLSISIQNLQNMISRCFIFYLVFFNNRSGQTYLWGSKFNYLLVKLTYVLCRPLFLYYFSTFPVGILSLDETGGSGILPTGILFKKVYKIHLTSPIKVSKGSDRCMHGLFDDLFKELK